MWLPRCGSWRRCMDVYLNPLQGKCWRSSAGFPRYYFNTFQVREFSKSINGLDEMYSSPSPTSCFLRAAMLFSWSIGGHPHKQVREKNMATQPHSNFRKVVQALIDLNPQQIDDSIDARDIADVTDLSVNQVSPYLSILGSLGCITKVGSTHRYRRYIRTLKPLTATAASLASLLRAYRTSLTRRKQPHCNPRQPGGSTKNLTTPTKTSTKMLIQRPRSPHLPIFSEQLALFPLSHTSPAPFQGKGSKTARRK
jgi:hypothetical protein